MFSGAFAIADESDGLNIANEVVLFGPAIDLISKLKGAEMGDQNGLCALFPLDIADSHQRVYYLDHFLSG